MPRSVVAVLLFALLAPTACKPASDDAPPAPAVSPLAVPAEALAAVDSATLMSYVRVLAADSLLGRAPGSAGEDKTIAYLVDQFTALGLKPGNTDGTYIQKVPLVGITVTNSPTLTFAKGNAKQTLKWRDD